MSAPLRIAFVVTRDTRAGTYFRYQPLAADLVRQGHQVTVYTQQYLTAPGADEVREGVRYRIATRRRGDRWIDPAHHPLSFLERLRQPIGECDVCHLFQPFENSALLWLRERRRRGTRTLFAWDWDDLFFEGLLRPEVLPPGARLRARLLGHFEHLLPRRAGLVTTCSEFLATRARERGAARVTVIHNGFVPPPQPRPRAAVRARWNLPSDAFLLGFVGWTPTEIDWCLHALERLDARVHLICCGVAVDKIAAAAPPSVAARVHYSGMLPPEDARELMTALDVGLLPLAPTDFNQSRLPIKFADYLAAGLPVLASEVGETGVLGRRLKGVTLLPPEPDAWAAGCADAVRRALEGHPFARPDPAQLHELLDWSVLGAQLGAAYREAGAGRRTVAA